MSQGYVLRNVNRVLTFKSKAWLKPYTEKNTDLRSKATSNFEKDLWKLINNAVYGKQIENVRQRVNIQYTDNPEYYIKKPTFKNIKDLNSLYLVKQAKRYVTLDKPIYGGLAILDYSKILMSRFHYNFFTKKFPNVNLLFTDADSLCYEVETEDVYKELSEDADEWFDFSNYPEDHPLFSTTNKKVLGLFKDELGGIPMQKFVGLRSKQYSYMYGNNTVSKCKSINKHGIRNITFDDYLKVLQENTFHFTFMNMIRSHDHIIYTEKVKKKTLDGNDEKRVILKDGIHTLPHGYYLSNFHVSRDMEIICLKKK